MVDVNRAYARMYGKRAPTGRQGPGRSGACRVPRRAAGAGTARARRRVARDRRPPAVASDGTVFDMEVRCIPFEHHGQPHVLGIARDITERRRRRARRCASARSNTARSSTPARTRWCCAMPSPNRRRQPAFLRDVRLHARRGDRRARIPPSCRPTDVADRRELRAPRARRRNVREASPGRSARTARSFAVELRVFPFEHRGEPHVLAIARDITGRAIAERRREARCATARSSTARSSTPRPTACCCATRSSASSTSTRPTWR